MAVYTEVSDEEVAAFAADYDIGDVIACKGIAEGVENSNYLLVTTAGRFILTLYERRVALDDLPFFLTLMEHLASHGIPCPLPLTGRDGTALRRLAGRPGSSPFWRACGRAGCSPSIAPSLAAPWPACIWPGPASR